MTQKFQQLSLHVLLSESVFCVEHAGWATFQGPRPREEHGAVGWLVMKTVLLSSLLEPCRPARILLGGMPAVFVFILGCVHRFLGGKRLRPCLGAVVSDLGLAELGMAVLLWASHVGLIFRILTKGG